MSRKREEQFYKFFVKETERLGPLQLPMITAYKIDEDATPVHITNIVIENYIFKVEVGGKYIPFQEVLENYYIEGFDNQECFKTKKWEEVGFLFQLSMKRNMAESIAFFSTMIGISGTMADVVSQQRKK